MREENRQTLEDALRRIPDYQAPDGIWSAVATQLSEEAALKELVQQLPRHRAPADSWDMISRQLKRPGSTRTYLRWMGAAAAVLLLITAGSWYLTRNPARVSYVQDTADRNAALQVRDWDADEAAIFEVKQRFARYRQLYGTPEQQSLLEELETLDRDKKELQQVIDDYGADADLIRKISAIERARTDLVQEMTKTIIGA